MPNIESAKKRVRTSAKRKEINNTVDAARKTAIKKAQKAIVNNADNKEILIKDAIKKIDKSASKGLIHKNKAAREKSNLTKNK